MFEKRIPEGKVISSTFYYHFPQTSKMLAVASIVVVVSGERIESSKLNPSSAKERSGMVVVAANI